MDPRYTDFDEVEFLALHPTTQKELWNKRWVPDLFRLVSVLGRGSSQVGGKRVQFDSLLLRADKNKHLDFGGSFWLIH